MTGNFDETSAGPGHGLALKSTLASLRCEESIEPAETEDATRCMLSLASSWSVSPDSSSVLCDTGGNDVLRYDADATCLCGCRLDGVSNDAARGARAEDSEEDAECVVRDEQPARSASQESLIRNDRDRLCECCPLRIETG